MAEIDTFGTYVRARLDEWGREFALHRDCEYLGHQSKNVLQVLIDHKGELPGRAQGFKPLDVPMDALQVEFMVADIAREQKRLACVLRAYFCGSGRRKVERYETALLLIANVERDDPVKATPPNVRRYLTMIELGTAEIRGRLIGSIRRAA